MDANGNNSLVALPFMLMVWLAIPIERTALGYLFGAFFLLLWFGAFLTNQFHKWAHMHEPPAAVAWLPRKV